MSNFTKGSTGWYKDKGKEIGNVLETIFIFEHKSTIAKLKQMGNKDRLDYINDNELPMEILKHVADREFTKYINGRIPLKDWIKYNKDKV